MKKLIFFLIPIFLLAEAHIFVLHRIDDNRHPSANTSKEELIKYFEYLKKNNYKVVTLSTLIKMQKQNLPLDKIVVFTIDDGYKSFYKNALPLFKKYNYPFTLFIYVKATNEKWGDFMTWKQVKNSNKFGEIGIHSYAHPHLPKLSNEEIIKDTKKAIEVFKKNLGFVPNMYAYPYGEYNKRVKEIINRYFKIIANQNPGAFDKSTPINDIDRIALIGKVNIKNKLKIKVLKIKNLQINKENNIIKKISGYVDKKVVEIYITDFGWKRVKVKNGYFEYYPNFKLKRYRNRVIIRYNYEMISKLILKEE